MKDQRLQRMLMIGIAIAFVYGSACQHLGPNRSGVESPWLEGQLAEGDSSRIVRNWLVDFMPFSPRGYVEYIVADSSKVQILLKDTLGNVWDVLVDEWQKPGRYGASFHFCSLFARSIVWKLHLEFRAGDARQVSESFVGVKGMWYDRCSGGSQTIRGVITGTFGDAMPMNPSIYSRPLDGVSVELREFRDSLSKAGPIIASTLTDSMGRYAMSAPKGRYFFVIRASDCGFTHTSGHGNFDMEDCVLHFEIFDQPDSIITKDVMATSNVTW